MRPDPFRTRSMQALINDLSGYVKMTQEEETALFGRYRAGDRRALDTICRRCIFLVISAANAYKGQGVEIEDLVAHGNIGLLRAAETFDPDKNFRFTSYAIWYVRCEFINAIKNNGQLIRNKAHRFNPLVALKYSYQDIDDPAMPIADNRENGYESASTRQAVRDIIEELPETDREIILRYYGMKDGFDYVMREIGEKLGYHQATINQRIVNIKKRLEKDCRLRALAIAG